MKVTVKYLLVLMLLAGITTAHAQEKGSAALGKWLNEEQDAKIEIYQTGKTYSGKIIWLREPNEENGKPKKDDLNPDEKSRNRPILNLVILRNFTYKNDTWEAGEVYDPKSGKTYSATMKLEDGNLEIRGYVGVSWLGRTTTWTKAEN